MSNKAEDSNSTSYSFASISGEMLGDKDRNLFGDEGVSTATNSSQNGSVADEETTTVQSENTRSRSSKSSLKTVWRLSGKWKEYCSAFSYGKIIIAYCI